MELAARLGPPLRLDRARVRCLLEADSLVLDEWEARVFVNVFRELGLPLDIERQGGARPARQKLGRHRARPAVVLAVVGAALLAGTTAFFAVDPAGLPAALGSAAKAPRLLAVRLPAVPQDPAEARPNVFSVAWRGNPQEVAEALRGGADPGRRDAQGQTPLMYAAAHNTKEAVELLLEAGADPNATSPSGQTPLVFAVRDNPDPAVAAVLAAAGASPAARTADGRTLVEVARAAGDGRLQLLRELFFRAARSGSSEQIGAWLAAGLPADLRDAYGQTPLMYAAQNSAGALHALLEGGASVNASSEAGWTALMYAARDAGGVAAARELLEAGADPTLQNGAHQTAKDIAAASGNRAVLELLQEFEPGQEKGGASAPAQWLPETALRAAAAATGAAGASARSQELEYARSVLRQCLQNWERCGAED